LVVSVTQPVPNANAAVAASTYDVFFVPLLFNDAINQPVGTFSDLPVAYQNASNTDKCVLFVDTYELPLENFSLKHPGIVGVIIHDKASNSMSRMVSSVV